MDQHNEPFRQQPDADHPLSALNSRAVPAEDVTDALLGTYGRHWLVTFVASKYGTTRQGAKETNLFLALATLLALFPGSPTSPDWHFTKVSKLEHGTRQPSQTRTSAPGAVDATPSRSRQPSAP
jgi:hypothetical protein